MDNTVFYRAKELQVHESYKFLSPPVSFAHVQLCKHKETILTSTSKVREARIKADKLKPNLDPLFSKPISFYL